MINRLKEYFFIQKSIKFWKQDFYQSNILNTANIVKNASTSIVYCKKNFKAFSSSQLKKFAIRNSFWVYFNQHFPFNSELLPEEISKNLAKPQKQLSRYFSKRKDKTTILTTYSFNGLNLLILLCISANRSEKIPLTICINKKWQNKITYYLKSILKDHYAESMQQSKLCIISNKQQTDASLLQKLQEPGIILAISDQPPKNNLTITHPTPFLKSTISIETHILSLAAKLNIPILPVTAIIKMNQLRLKFFPLIKLNVNDIKLSRMDRTMRRIFNPLRKNVPGLIAGWLNWELFNKYNPKVPVTKPIQQTKLKGLLKTEHIITFEEKNLVYLINIYTGFSISLPKKIYSVLTNSKNMDVLSTKLKKIDTPIDSESLSLIIQRLNNS